MSVNLFGKVRFRSVKDLLIEGRGEISVSGVQKSRVLEVFLADLTLDGVQIEGASRDFLFGGDDDDTLSGGTGNDDLFGESGDDVLNGQGGTDPCDGGTTGETAGETATATCETLVGIP